MSVDVTQESGCSALVEECLSHFGRLDILINNAGINLRGAIDELSLETFQQVMNTNVTGCWLAARAAVPVMKRAGWGANYQSRQHLGGRWFG